MPFMNETVAGFLYFKYNKKGAESLRFSSLRRGRVMNLLIYSIVYQCITPNYTTMGYELGNILKRASFDCQ